MMFRIFVFALFLLLANSVLSQKQFSPKWEKGDTLRYFISESHLVDDDRISLRTYELELMVLSAVKDQFMMAAKLHINANPNQERHWALFFTELKAVSFFFQLHPDSGFALSSPIQAEKSLAELNQALQRFISHPAVEPKEYFEVIDWLMKLNEPSGIPQMLCDHLSAINPVFNHYGIFSNTNTHFKSESIFCNDKELVLNWVINDSVSSTNTDSLFVMQRLSLNQNNQLETFQELNRCGKLVGLDDPIQFDRYHFLQKQTWSGPEKGKLFHYYRFEQETKVQMGEILNWQRVQKQIVGLSH